MSVVTWKKTKKKEEGRLSWPKINVIISGGGTGGHIFPAVAIAQALMRLNPQNEILFVGAQGRMEMEKVPAAGFRIIGLNISGIQRRLTLSNLTLPFKIIASLWKARSIVRSFRPDVAVGVGGYASGPLLFAATGQGVPALIQEQNSFAGVTNRILAKRVKKICVAYEGMERYFPQEKIMLTGNPVRTDLVDIAQKRSQALAHFGLSSDKPVVLVIGGSLGARTINQSIADGIPSLLKHDIQLIWQTGKSGFAAAQASVSNPAVKVFDFITKMDLAYAAADVVVSRAGASSVSEIAIAGKASILVPSPNVAEDHQTKNAMALVQRSAALMVRDANAREQLIGQILSLVSDQVQREKLASAVSAMALPDAAHTIAQQVYQLART